MASAMIASRILKSYSKLFEDNSVELNDMAKLVNSFIELFLKINFNCTLFDRVILIIIKSL